MYARILPLVPLVALLVGTVGTTAWGAEPAKAPAYKFSGPFTHDNLTIFLIHGDDLLKGKDILTLQEGLEQKKVVVHETKNVNELAIENVSDQEVFVQAGDIVKGGSQDRTIATDAIVPAKSGKIPLNSFCVEAGRWRKRGEEEESKFSSSGEQIGNRELKIAARKAMKQQEVWKEVANAQKKLSLNVKANVQSAQSASSYQLTLENKKVQEAVEAHVKALANSTEGKKDVIGYAFAINGKFSSADLYASNALFNKLWAKHLRSAAIEAVSELQPDKKTPAVTTDQCKAFLADADAAKTSEKDVNARTKTMMRETDKTIQFDTRDAQKKEVILRRNVLAH
jgi:hypothetical protein